MAATSLRLPTTPRLSSGGWTAHKAAMIQYHYSKLLVERSLDAHRLATGQRDVALALRQLSNLSPRIVSLAPYRLSDVWEDVLRVGRALEREELAKKLVQGYQQRLHHLSTATASLSPSRPQVAVLEWLDPLMAAGNWTPELVTYAGGEPVFVGIGEHSP